MTEDEIKQAAKRVFDLRVRIQKQLEAWGVGLTSETCGALLSLAADCIDGADVQQLRWFCGMAMSMASGHPVDTRVYKLGEDGEN